MSIIGPASTAIVDQRSDAWKTAARFPGSALSCSRERKQRQSRAPTEHLDAVPTSAGNGMAPRPKANNHLMRFLLPALALVLCFGVMMAAFAPDAWAYEVRWQGDAERSILEDLESVSDTLKWKDRPPATTGLLRRRAEGDIEMFLKVLRSAGHYGAEVSLDIQEEEGGPVVVFRIEPGEVFRLESIQWTAPETDRAILERLPPPKDLGLSKGDPARAQAILDAERGLIQALQRNARPFARVEDRRVVVDHRDRTVRVTLHLDPGPPARFGSTNVSGLKTVSETTVRNRLHWKEGEPWNADLIAETRKELARSELFSLVQIIPAEELDEQGRLDLSLDVGERKHRSIKLGAGYRTDEGPGGRFSWEHRNLFNHGEKLKLSVTGSTLATAFDTSFEKPDFLTPRQTLRLASKLASEDTDAYNSRYLDSAVSVERTAVRAFKWSVGPGFRWSRVEQLDETDEFALVFLQSGLVWDRSDDLLDPTRGGRLILQLAPYWDTLGTASTLVRGSGSYSHYFRLMEKPLVVFAARAGLGTIAGAERNAVPADLRFYAGGGGSVRGYPFQTLGPLEEDRDPIGGRSLLEINAELRYRVTRNIGLVAFLDGGSAFESSTPDFSEDVLWGAGLGLRYHTPIGPLRLDVAVPLQKRDEIDDWFQVYVSIGQAF